jgi:pilus assembly protein Flp/PilA
MGVGCDAPPGQVKALDKTEHQMLKFLKNEDGATAIEYGLIAALIGVAIITAVGLVGDQLETTFEDIEAGLKGT